MKSRLQGCWKGACRGSKFGAKAGAVIWVVIYAGMFQLTCIVPTLREDALAQIQRGLDSWDVLKLVGSLVASFGLMVMYGVAAGVVVMGLMGLLRRPQLELVQLNGAVSEELS